MRRIWCGLATFSALAAISSTRLGVSANAQTLGEMGAASSMSGTLGSGGGGMSTAPSSYLRGLPPSSGIPGGGDPTNFGDASRGGSSGSPSPSGFPNPNLNPGRGAGGTAATSLTPATHNEPFHWDDMRGADYVRELRSRSTRRASRTRVALNRAPYRAPYRKYPLRPRGWLSYYLQQDRYKFAVNLWNYVSIEDDRGRYPVRYYYRPNSPTFLALLANTPHGVRRYNRVVGFKSWQDAMIAGLRPDPVSKPEPAPRVLQLAGLTRSDGAMRMIEAAYAGQMSPAQFNSSVDYVGQVARSVRANRATRALAPRTINQVVLALLGEAEFPTRVVGTRSRVVRIVTQSTTQTTTSGVPNGAPIPPGAINPTAPNFVPSGGAPENRMDNYNRFQNNAAGLRR